MLPHSANTNQTTRTNTPSSRRLVSSSGPTHTPHTANLNVAAQLPAADAAMFAASLGEIFAVFCAHPNYVSDAVLLLAARLLTALAPSAAVAIVGSGLLHPIIDVLSSELSAAPDIHADLLLAEALAAAVASVCDSFRQHRAAVALSSEALSSEDSISSKQVLAVATHLALTGFVERLSHLCGRDDRVLQLDSWWRLLHLIRSVCAWYERERAKRQPVVAN